MAGQCLLRHFWFPECGPHPCPGQPLRSEDVTVLESKLLCMKELGWPSLVKLSLGIRFTWSFTCSLIYSHRGTPMGETESRQIIRAVEICTWRRKCASQGPALKCLLYDKLRPPWLPTANTDFLLRDLTGQPKWPCSRWVRFWCVLVSLFLGPRLERQWLPGASSACGLWLEHKTLSQATQAHP